MGEQSWRQQVDDLDPHRTDDEIAYTFSQAGVRTPNSRKATGAKPSRPVTQGVFREKKLHGAYDGNNS